MSEEKVTLTFRTDSKTREALDDIAKWTDRDRNWVTNEALAQKMWTRSSRNGEPCDPS